MAVKNDRKRGKMRLNRIRLERQTHTHTRIQHAHTHTNTETHTRRKKYRPSPLPFPNGKNTVGEEGGRGWKKGETKSHEQTRARFFLPTSEHSFKHA